MNADQTIYDLKPGDAEMITGLASKVFDLVISERTDNDGNMPVDDLYLASIACEEASICLVEVFLRNNVGASK